MKIRTLQHSTCRLGGKFLLVATSAMMTLTNVHASYQSTVLSDGPLAYYPLNLNLETTGTASDLSGNANSGTYVNIDPVFNNVAGPSAFITNAVSFDGQTTYVDLATGSNPGLLDFSGPITMEAWVQSTIPALFGDILAKGYDSANNNYELQIRGNGANNGGNYNGGTYGPAGSRGASGGTQDANWSHVVLVNDGANWSLYVNGTLVQRNGDTVGAINFSAPWRIGTGSASGANRFFSGNISQVALYNYGLSTAQVYAHYFAGKYGSTPDTSVPIITLQPAAQSCYAGGAVRFSVGVLSVLPTTNQWFKGGSPIPGQTNASLTLLNVQATDVASYSVVVGNSNGATNSAASSLSLLTVTPPATGASLAWNTNNTGAWDNGSSVSWKNLGTSLATTFTANDAVLFDDTTGVPAAVSLNETVSPSYITNNSSANNFTISGGGFISGAASLVKLGSSTLEMATANDFTGGATIAGGTVQMDAPLSGAATTLGAGNAAPIIVTNGATLAVKASGGYPQGNSGISTRQIVISGAGVGGNGALRSIGNDIYHDGAPNGGLFRSLRLAGNATIGSGGRWDLGRDGLFTAISTGGSNYNLTCLQGSYSEWHEVSIDRNLGDLDYILASGSTWSVYGMGTTGLGNPTNTLTLHPGINMTIWHGNNNADSGYAKIIHVQGTSQFSYRPGGGVGDYHLDAALQLDDNASLNFYNGNGGNNSGVTVGGAVKFNGAVHLSVGDSPITFTNVISGAGGFVWDTYNNTVFFTANNTYAGPSVIGDGRTLALTGNGAISQSSLIFFGGNNTASVRLDVSGRPDQTLTLAGGQTLAGIGMINGRLSVAAGATLSPAGTNTTLGITAGANSTGTISATDAIVLNGTTTIKLNGSGANDAVQSFGAGITYGGTLNLVNISGSPLAIGNSFQIASATSYTGSFASITPATPGAGLAWDLSQLNIGFINVVASGGSGPVIGSTTVSGSNLIFSGTGGSPNTGFYVLSTTNITTAVTNWSVISTNSFDNTGAFNLTNAVSPGVPKRFFMLKLQ
jgi:autotransporter-associated beta strand protein